LRCHNSLKDEYTMLVTQKQQMGRMMPRTSLSTPFFRSSSLSFLRLKPLVCAMACLSASVAVQAGSTDFADGAGKISFDSTFSMGASVRTQDPDKRIVGIVNGGTSRSVNEDNGNLNYKKGEVFAAVLKGSHDFDVSYGDTGFFARFGYFTDIAAAKKDFGFRLSSPEFAGESESERDLGIIPHKRLDFDAELFDAYVRTQFDIAGRPLNIRLGRQVVSWGESTLIQGGINVINPVDLTRLRTPGAELKEAFIPVPMLYVSQQLSDNITIEAFNQFRFEPFKIDPLGTFFSSTDVFSPGGQQSFTGFGRTPDNAHGESAIDNSTIPRGRDRYAKDSGQYGGALRFFLPDLNNSEMALYALNYHSRLPLASLTQAPCKQTPPGGVLDCVPSQRDATQASVFAGYPENIQLFGISMNTPGPFGIALQGEYSYRPNLPVQLATVELTLAALGLPNQAGYGSDVPNDPNGKAKAAGEVLQGYRRVEAHQVQFTGTKSIPNLLGAEQVILLAEAAYFFQDLPDHLKFAGPATYLPSRQSGTLSYPTPLVANGSVQPGDQGYATKSSYGYRLVSRLEYTDVFAGVNLLPRIVFSHDVKGVSSFFTEDVKALSLGLNATYNQAWNFDMAYTNFFGGRVFKGTDCTTDLTSSNGTLLGLGLPLGGATGQAACSLPAGPTQLPSGQATTYESIANPSIDRDFVAASLSYSF